MLFHFPPPDPQVLDPKPPFKVDAMFGTKKGIGKVPFRRRRPLIRRFGSDRRLGHAPREAKSRSWAR